MNAALELPEQSGAYRWLYLDVTSGEDTAVAIFMLGSVFSPRYARGLSRGASPMRHCAVNFALYRGGVRRVWVLTEYPGATLTGQHTLTIGGSRWRWRDDGSIEVEICDRAAPFGPAVRAEIALSPGAAQHAAIALDPAARHFWEPRAPRSHAQVRVPQLGVSFEGRAYHDGNHGTEPLGARMPGWRWTRVHGPELTQVTYEPWGVDAIQVAASDRQLAVERRRIAAAEGRRSGWGLSVPTQLAPWTQVALPAPRLVESSPFYARLEAADAHHHALAEVADFRRFHRPSVRWMAHFRERVARASP